LYSTDPNAVRFREARERAGLSPDEAASRMGISSASLWDIECCDDELKMIYSPAQIALFSRVLGIRARELFGIELEEGGISATELATLIREHCRSRRITVEQFEDSAGWSIAQSLEQPERFLHDYSIDGIQDICRELDINWQRVILSL
jgi:DNA-binding XRE family transcriptional regulator